MEHETDARAADFLAETIACPACAARMAVDAKDCPVCGFEPTNPSPADIMAAHLALFGR